MSLDAMGTIDRVRRAMPRNPDVMQVCDVAEAGIKAHQTALNSSKCAICEERRQSNKVAMQTARAKKKGAAVSSDDDE